MATKQSTVDFILDQLAPQGEAKTRKMFGEYALYFAGKVVGLICDDTLFIKITEPGQQIVGEKQKIGHAYPGAKPSFAISPEQIEDADWLGQLVQVTAQQVPAPALKKKTKSKRVSSGL